MYDIELRRMIMNDRIDTLRHDAHRPAPRTSRATAVEASDIELRLCKPADDPALDRLAALAERPLPFGRLVVALADGRLVAALPLAGGRALTDPFSRTAHLLRLLELRANQLRQPEPRAPRAARLLRRHA